MLSPLHKTTTITTDRSSNRRYPTTSFSTTSTTSTTTLTTDDSDTHVMMTPILSRTTAILFGKHPPPTAEQQEVPNTTQPQLPHIHSIRSSHNHENHHHDIHHHNHRNEHDFSTDHFYDQPDETYHHNNNNKMLRGWDRIRSYLFGFMYEEMELEDSIDHYYQNQPIPNHNTNYQYHHHHSRNSSTTTYCGGWTHRSFRDVTIPLAVALALQSMATSMIYSILSSMGHEMTWMSRTADATTWISTASTTTTTTSSFLWQPIQQFVQQMVSISLCGTAIGKFCNGPVVDIYGARRTSILYTFIMCTVLLVLAMISTTSMIVSPFYMIGTLIFILEFVSSVQWPCTIVILATHFRNTAATTEDGEVDDDDDEDNENMDVAMASSTNTAPNISSMKHRSTGSWYESGIFITSLSSRIGSMMGILFASYCLSYQIHWRTIVYMATYLTAIAVSILYLYVRDSPPCANAPQNPMDPNLYRKWFPEQLLHNRRWSMNRLLRLLMFIVQTNVLPSVRHILGSSTFWIVTLAHTGTSMVRTSQRLLGSYFLMTSDGTLSYEQAVSYSIWYSTGTVLGLFIAGTIFTKGCRNDRQRKYMILRLYVVTILSCYVLAIMAIPGVRNMIQAPELIRIIQTMAVTTIGFGVAVQLYHIPSLVGATFGCDKGLFVSYNDGVAYVFVALAWRYVGRAMQVDDTYYSPSGGGGGGGWAYGWAAVALLLIVSTFLMVEFMEHYFCRPKYGTRGGGSYETIIFS